MPRSHWLLTGRVRSLQPVRPVTPKTAELDNNGYVLKWGVYILLLLVQLSPLPICSAEKHLWSARESKSLVG